MAALEHGRLEKLEAFDETKAGVKGLVDQGIAEVPSIFVRSQEDISRDYPTAVIGSFHIPVIDLQFGIESQRNCVVDSIRRASETLGFFQLVNHGVPEAVMNDMLKGVRAFFELPKEQKMKLYRRDSGVPAKYVSNFDLYTTGFANWRDTLAVMMHPEEAGTNELPLVCRDKIAEYSKHIDKLATTLFELLSEALSLDSNHLSDLGCTGGHTLQCHYYPPCPEPELTMGISKHTDPCFITILLQDQTGGLQVLYENKFWIDVPHVDGALVVNMGDLLQILSNDKFTSAAHRAVVKTKGPRISVAAFCKIHHIPRVYGPIKELTSEDNPPKYREITGNKYISSFRSKGLDGIPPLQSLKL